MHQIPLGKPQHEYMINILIWIYNASVISQQTSRLRIIYMLAIYSEIVHLSSLAHLEFTV